MSFPLLDRTITLPNFFDSSDPHSIEIRSIIEELIQEFINRKAGYELIIKSKLYNILGLMIRNFHQVTGHNRSSLGGNAEISEEFRILLQYIEQNFNQSININDAAKMINVSPSHFCRLFKRITGKTLIEYVNVLRIYKAESLLMEPNLTVTEIAEKIGFGSLAYFGRVFRDIKNISPTDYRKRKR